MRSKKKLFAIIATVAMLAGMLAFGVLPSVASTASVTATVQTVLNTNTSGYENGVGTNPAPWKAGTVSVTGLSGSSGVEDDVYVEPLGAYNIDSFSNLAVATTTVQNGDPAYVAWEPATPYTITPPSAGYTYGAHPWTSMATIPVMFSDQATGAAAPGDIASVYFTPMIDFAGVPFGAGPINLQVWDSTGQLAKTVVQIGTSSAGNGSVTLTTSPPNAIAQGGSGAPHSITFTESAPGALGNTSTSEVTITLPSGMTWASAGSFNAVSGWSGVAGTNASGAPTYGALTATINGDEMTVTASTPSSGSAGSFEIDGTSISVPANAPLGNFTATLGGAASGTLALGSVGNYSATVTAASTTPTIYASHVSSTTGGGQEIGGIDITESLPGSLEAGRTIYVTLPSNEQWDATGATYILPNAAVSPTGFETNVYVSAGSLVLGSVGNAPYKVDANNSSQLDIYVGQASSGSTPADIHIDGYVYTGGSTYTGPMTVTVSGNAGVSGTVTAGTVASSITATASGTPNAVLGQQNQAVGDVTLTEGTNGVLTKNLGVAIVAPLGATFNSTPTVSVASGDIQLGTPSVTTASDGQSEIFIPVNTASSTASSIKVSGITMSLSSGQAIGPVTLAVDNGPNTNGVLGTNLTSVNVANAVSSTTAASSAMFTVGSTVFSMNGVQNVMDAAPYISDGRTYVPVRYLGEALGAKVDWDAATQTVTLTLGSTTETLTIGSTTMTVNGQAQTMDVAPVIVAPGRTMLPARFVAQGFGYNVGWNPVNSEVLITKSQS